MIACEPLSWTCHVFVPPLFLICAACTSKAKELYRHRAEIEAVVRGGEPDEAFGTLDYDADHANFNRTTVRFVAIQGLATRSNTSSEAALAPTVHPVGKATFCMELNFQAGFQCGDDLPHPSHIPEGGGQDASFSAYSLRRRRHPDQKLSTSTSPFASTGRFGARVRFAYYFDHGLRDFIIRAKDGRRGGR